MTYMNVSRHVHENTRDITTNMHRLRFWLCWSR